MNLVPVAETPTKGRGDARTLSAAGVLPPTTLATLVKLNALQDQLLTCEQLPIRTEHILHGGMYARTVRLDPGVVITGALVKVPTVLMVSGHCKVLVDDGWMTLEGVNIFPASANRKQVFVAITETIITCVLYSKARTLAEAEAEFTDECDRLLSRQQSNDLVVITGE